VHKELKLAGKFTNFASRQKEEYAALSKFKSFLELTLPDYVLTFGMDADEFVLLKRPFIHEENKCSQLHTTSPYLRILQRRAFLQ
jgi:hypothetical protein